MDKTQGACALAGCNEGVLNTILFVKTDATANNIFIFLLHEHRFIGVALLLKWQEVLTVILIRVRRSLKRHKLLDGVVIISLILLQGSHVVYIIFLVTLS